MPGATRDGIPHTDAVRSERARILSTLLDELDDLTEAAIEAIRAEIPAYKARDEPFFDDVRDQVRQHYGTQLKTFLADGSVTLEDIAFVRGAAMRRARAGFALEDYVNAYRVGQQVLWDAIVAQAGDTTEGHEAALPLAMPVMRYANFASTQAARAYVDFQQYALADADRERRDLLEHLLAGEMPTRGPLLAAAQSYGLGPEARMMVAAAVPADQSSGSDAPQAASAAIARLALHEAKTLVVVRQAEIVAVPTLGPGTDPLKVCDGLEAVQKRLRKEGVPLAMGIGTLAVGVAELPRAYREARAALECAPDEGGVAALPRLSSFEYLASRADETASRLIDPRVRTFLDEDGASGGVLTATIRALVDANLQLRATAERLQIHPNTAQYRLGRIEDRTGRNPRHLADLLELLVAIELDGRPTDAGG
jgi:PucR-like helix-turn-helix protein/diguanylate cyclase with GGDEF domain